MTYCRPPEDFGQKTVETDGASDTDEADGVMPSFYKFCAKTATGVFDKTLHTIKTALPGAVHGIGQNDNAWIFVQTSQSVSFKHTCAYGFVLFCGFH